MTEPQPDEVKPLALDITSVLARSPKLDVKGRRLKKKTPRKKQMAPSDFAKELTAKLEAVEMTQTRVEGGASDEEKVREQRKEESGPGSSGTEKSYSEIEESSSDGGAGGWEERDRAREQRARRRWWCKLATSAITATTYATILATSGLSVWEDGDSEGARCEKATSPTVLRYRNRARPPYEGWLLIV